MLEGLISKKSKKEYSSNEIELYIAGTDAGSGIKQMCILTTTGSTTMPSSECLWPDYEKGINYTRTVFISRLRRII